MKNTETEQTIKNKMADLSPEILIITLHVNALNIAIKRQISQVDTNKWPNYILSTRKSL